MSSNYKFSIKSNHGRLALLLNHLHVWNSKEYSQKTILSKLLKSEKYMYTCYVVKILRKRPPSSTLMFHLIHRGNLSIISLVMDFACHWLHMFSRSVVNPELKRFPYGKVNASMSRTNSSTVSSTVDARKSIQISTNELGSNLNVTNPLAIKIRFV